MTSPNADPTGPLVLVSDFDGTMTRYDFYQLAIARLLPKNVPDYWGQYRAGEITHFEALRRYFAAIRATEHEVLQVVRDMELDSSLSIAVSRLKELGWRIVVTSAGCDWYIHKLLTDANVEIEVHANRGWFNAGKGLQMEMPTESPYWSPTLGVDKEKVVSQYLAQGWTVAFAGDGFPDFPAAKRVVERLRFARGDLANELSSNQLSFRPFDRWSEIAAILEREVS